MFLLFFFYGWCFERAIECKQFKKASHEITYNIINEIDLLYTFSYQQVVFSARKLNTINEKTHMFGFTIWSHKWNCSIEAKINPMKLILSAFGICCNDDWCPYKYFSYSSQVKTCSKMNCTVRIDLCLYAIKLFEL